MEGQCERGEECRVQAESKGDHPRVRSCGGGELSVHGERSQGENLGTEHGIWGGKGVLWRVCSVSFAVSGSPGGLFPA